MENRVLNISELINNNPLSLFQIRLIAICTLIAALEGFDVQALVFAAPKLAKLLHLDNVALGHAMAMSLIGVIFGAAIMGVVSDKFGCRKAILSAILIFGVSSLLTTQISSLTELMAVRFFTGIGIGGVYPVVAALSSEYTPHRKRAVLVTLMFSGFSLGAIIGGVVNAKLIAVFGWKSAFEFDGTIPLILFPVLFFIIPESLYYLARRGYHGPAVDRILEKIEGRHSYATVTLMADGPVSQKSSLASLFLEGRAFATILISITFFGILMLLAFLFNWLPIVLQDTGLSLNKAIYAVVALQIGGITGGLAIGRLIDKNGPYRILPFCLLLGALFTMMVGVIGTMSAGLLIVMLFGEGVFCIGTTFCLYAFVAQFYPPEMRATGVGWATAFGRIGSILGPVLGGVILSLKLDIGMVFFLAGIPALVATVSVSLIKYASPPRLVQSNATAS